MSNVACQNYLASLAVYVTKPIEVLYHNSQETDESQQDNTITQISACNFKQKNTGKFIIKFKSFFLQPMICF